MPVFWGVVKGLLAGASIAALKSRIMAIAVRFLLIACLFYIEFR